MLKAALKNEGKLDILTFADNFDFNLNLNVAL